MKNPRTLNPFRSAVEYWNHGGFQYTFRSQKSWKRPDLNLASYHILLLRLKLIVKMNMADFAAES